MEYDIRMMEPEDGHCPFERWFLALRDSQATMRIRARLVRIRDGNLGDVRGVGSGVSELRIDYGPGYRIYFAIAGSAIVVLLGGGDKSTQQRDIAIAQRLLQENKDAAEKFRRHF